MSVIRAEIERAKYTALYNCTEFSEYFLTLREMTPEESADYNDAFRRGVYKGYWIPRDVPIPDNLRPIVDLMMMRLSVTDIVFWPPTDEQRQQMEDRIRVPTHTAVPLGAPYTTAKKWIKL
jgi:hypothetical protein